MKQLLFLFLFTLGFLSHAQNQKYQTVEETVNTMLEVISVEIGEEPDWDTYRNLFLPTAQKILLNPKAKNPSNRARSFSVEEFIRYVGPLYGRDGFDEVVTGLTVNEFNGVANAFQSYHAKNLTGTYDKKGINCYQLVWVDGRWWIASTTWAAENEEHKIPEKYLNASK
ncbi:hypothetical protein [Flagellimonas flava]|uniref:DUF4440 domain-containing protein n=1 Tax=Flagellimonas flava TaxID=570519 RepID=A0A1M5IMR9_9FLAO|nr:hypothetical protein [Allomuricauda flava]SHG29618.1 hypothetical protein SAMN04488116_0815 [Allomuricauda flava]